MIFTKLIISVNNVHISGIAQPLLGQMIQSYGQFSRAFTLSDEVDQEKIKASYKDGILHLQLPLKEKKENKSTIKVM